MFDRAFSRVVAVAAASAAAVMAVFASGFSLYALILPRVGAAGGAAIVALVAALGVALFALMAALRARQREREAEVAKQEIAESLPLHLGIGEIARERPIVALAVTALGGVLAAKHPTLARDLIAIVARFTRE